MLTETQIRNTRRWVAALRSGKYRQARRKLRVNDAYCCLGVACDLSGEGDWFEIEAGLWAYSIFGHRYADGFTGMWPTKVSILFFPGFAPIQIPSRAPGEVLGLAGLNDDAELTFTQIADVIEYLYPEVCQ